MSHILSFFENEKKIKIYVRKIVDKYIFTDQIVTENAIHQSGGDCWMIDKTIYTNDNIEYIEDKSPRW